jgi:hypothetical protein
MNDNDANQSPATITRRHLALAVAAGAPITAFGAYSVANPTSAWAAPHIVKAIAVPQAVASTSDSLTVGWSDQEIVYATPVLWTTTLTTGNDPHSPDASSMITVVVTSGDIVRLSNVERDTSVWSEPTQIGVNTYSFETLTPLQPGQSASLILTYEQTDFVDPFLSGATATVTSSGFTGATAGVTFTLNG